MPIQRSSGTAPAPTPSATNRRTPPSTPSTPGRSCWPLSDHLDGLFRLDYRLTGPTWFSTVQNQTEPTLFSGLLPISALALPAFVGNANYALSRRDAFGVFDVRAGLQGGRWKAVLFADNVLDKKYLAEVIPAIEFGGAFISPGARRRWGLEIGYKF